MSSIDPAHLSDAADEDRGLVGCCYSPLIARCRVPFSTTSAKTTIHFLAHVPAFLLTFCFNFAASSSLLGPLVTVAMAVSISGPCLSRPLLLFHGCVF